MNASNTTMRRLLREEVLYLIPAQPRMVYIQQEVGQAI